MLRVTAIFLASVPMSLAACLEAHSMTFLHIMKTGGLSVDARIQCGCNNWSPGCLYWSADRKVKMKGEAECKDVAVDSTHYFTAALINPAPITVTILRDPVSRVWSFYRYLRRWYVPYQNKTLEWNLETIDSKVRLATPGADDHFADAENCTFCEKELINGMSMRFSQTLYDTDDPAECRVDATPQAPTSLICFNDSPDRLRRLQQAKAALMRVGFIGFTDLLDESSGIIMELLWSLPQGERVPKTHTRNNCSLSDVNVTPDIIDGLPPLPHVPDNSVQSIIRKYNAIDILLYDFATTLPQALRAGHRPLLLV